jgi:hypothetical protein
MSYFERKQDKKPYKHIVDNHLKENGKSIYGMTDDRKKVVKVNKRLSKNKPAHKRPITKGAKKYPEVLDTIIHELHHEAHPKATEKATYKATHKKIRKIGKKAKKKLYAKFR